MPGLEGTTFGSYHLKQLLGQGGMSEVYLAYDAATEQDVAVKIMGGASSDFLERFRREAEAIDKLQHEHILPAYDYEEHEPWHYLVMKYVPGGTLRERIENTPLPLDEAADIFDQIVDAVQYAHDHGIIHRDIKPSNILLTDTNYVYLADFGLAKMVEGSSELTRTGSLMGTPEYMAPDLADGPATTSSDIYALGVLLYQMVTGQVPFDGENPVAIYWKHLRDQPAPPSTINEQLTRTIDRVILRALAKDPRQRYETATDLANAFRTALTAVEDEVLEPIAASAHDRVVLIDAEPSVRPYLATKLDEQQTARPRRRYGLVRARQFVTSRASWGKFSRMSPRRRRRLSGEQVVTELPPLPPRTSGVQHSNPPHRGGRKKRLPYAKMNSRLATMIILVGLLIIIVIPMSLIYFFSQQTKQTVVVNPPTSSVTTPTVNGVGELILADALSNNEIGRWAENAQSCMFRGGAYHVLGGQQNIAQPCVLIAPIVTDAVIQADVALLTGDTVGILLRLKGDQYYDFQINNVGQFFFRRHDAGAGNNYVVLQQPTASSAIAPGTAKNTLMVIAQGANFKLYINNIFVADIRDATYTSGQVGFLSSAQSATATSEGRFTNFKLTKVAS